MDRVSMTSALVHVRIWSAVLWIRADGLLALALDARDPGRRDDRPHGALAAALAAALAVPGRTVAIEPPRAARFAATLGRWKSRTGPQRSMSACSPRAAPPPGGPAARR